MSNDSLLLIFSLINMKICLVTADGTSGGIEKHILDLLEYLQIDHELTLIAPKSLTEKVGANIKSIPLDWNRSRRNPFLLVNLYKILNANKFDIVHSHGGKATFVLGLLKYLISFKLISTLHNNTKTKAKSYNNSDHVIGVSRNVFAESGFKGNSTSVIYNGIEAPEKHFSIRDEINKFFSAPKLPLFISVGRLVHAKGFDILIDSMQDINANLYIVGDGPLMQSLSQRIETNRLQGRVVLSGHKNNINQILQSSDACIITSRNEGFSYVALEALLNKTLIASTNVACAEFLPSHVILSNSPKEIAQRLNILLNNKAKWHEELEPFFLLAQTDLTLEAMAKKTVLEYKRLLN